jgi:hypothetical protein
MARTQAPTRWGRKHELGARWCGDFSSMKLERIFTMANEAVRLQFVAMERSLRRAGCDLPLCVIPFDDRLFPLPPNAYWHRDEPLFSWLQGHGCHPTMRKYACLFEANYHFLDTDIVVLRNPEEVVRPFTGLLASCTEWAKPQWTYTAASAKYFSSRSSTWMREVFSTGQFAIDRPLYTHESLYRVATSADFFDACIRYPLHEQPGINQLVLATDIPRTNLTLPPHNMQSTWAGDYPGGFEHLLRDSATAPYLIHWAGPNQFDIARPINRLFFDLFTPEELAEWESQRRARERRAEREGRRAANPLRRLARFLKREFTHRLH